MDKKTTLADRLVEFALRTRFEDLPAVVVVEAKRHLIDALASRRGPSTNPRRGSREPWRERFKANQARI